VHAAGDGLVRALAEGDFGEVADSFANAGFVVRVPARGILQLRGSDSPPTRMRLLLSVVFTAMKLRRSRCWPSCWPNSRKLPAILPLT